MFLLRLPNQARRQRAWQRAAPTMAVPFFGDQAFWGEMCRRSGVGPAPVAVENLSVEVLVEALEHLMQPEVDSLPMHRLLYKPFSSVMHIHIYTRCDCLLACLCGSSEPLHCLS